MSGRFFSCSSFRVVLSIAAMWSASTPCRRPEDVGDESEPGEDDCDRTDREGNEETRRS